jgi:hypothetical protein
VVAAIRFELIFEAYETSELTITPNRNILLAQKESLPAGRQGTFISTFVAWYSYPLNYKPSLCDFQIWTENIHLMFASQKERKMTMLPLHQAALFLICFILHFLIQHSLFPVHYSFGWLRPDSYRENSVPPDYIGILYQISPAGRQVKSTFVIEDRLELSSPDSESGMLPLHHSTICGSYESRTRSLW